MSRLERLLLAGGLVWAFLLCCGPTGNPDVPWHLAAARRILETRSIPRADFLSWTMEGKPWVNFEWLTQLIFHAAHALGGEAGLWLYKVACFAAVAGLFTALLALWGLGPVWIALGTPALMSALLPFIEVRPENLSLLFFLGQLYVLERRRLGLRTWHPAAQVVLYALWANLHAGFVMGLALCACYGAVSWAALGTLGTLLNPYGWGVYHVLYEHWKELPTLRKLILEWGTPSFINVYQTAYWPLVILSLAGMARAALTGAGLPLEHALTASAFVILSSRSFRTSNYIILALLPLGLLAWSRQQAPPWWPRARTWALAVLFAWIAWADSRVMRQDKFFQRLRIAEDVEPYQALEFLRTHKAELAGLKLYNPWNWGGFLDLHLYPDYKVFLDGRYLFTPLLREVWQAEAQPGLFKKFLEKHDIGVALMMRSRRVISYRNLTPWRPFDVYAMPRTDWALVYWDSWAFIMVRRDKAPKEWLARREYKILRPGDRRYLALRLVTDPALLPEVEAEVARYEKEIGDPTQTLVLTTWLAEFKKGLPRTRPPSASKKAVSRGS